MIGCRAHLSFRADCGDCRRKRLGWESNDARNTREFNEHRKLCATAISNALQREREQKAKRKR